MWYNKEAVKIMNKDYVKETTRWAGHSHVIYHQIDRPNDIA